jgi:hypothetical protein
MCLCRRGDRAFLAADDGAELDFGQAPAVSALVPWLPADRDLGEIVAVLIASARSPPPDEPPREDVSVVPGDPAGGTAFVIDVGAPP